MLRTQEWLAGAVFLGILAAGSARAQDCTSDDQCAKGSRCSYTRDAVPPCEPNTKCDDPAPVTGTCTPLSLGECEDDADCVDGLSCEKGESTPGCAVAEKPPADGSTDPTPPDPCPDQTPTVDRYGYCVLPHTSCKSDADCKLGLTCTEDATNGSGSGSAMGGSTGSAGSSTGVGSGGTGIAATMPKGGATSSCELVPVSCDNGAACPSGYSCDKVSTGTVCSGVATPSCAPDAKDCPTTPEPQPDPECMDTTANYCVPKFDACETDADCETNWVCVAFSNDASGLSTPDSWGKTGPVKSCLPEGMALAAQSGYGGHSIETPSYGADPVADDGNGLGTGAPEKGGASGGADSSGSTPPSTDNSSGSMKPSASSCAVASPVRRSGDFAGLLALGALGFLLVRRRRAA